MQRIMKAQALRSNDQMSHMMSRKTLEINPYNKIIIRIKEKLEGPKDNYNSIINSLHVSDCLFISP
jgi:molecular chaperone HtpG